VPTNEDEKGLRRLAAKFVPKKVQVSSTCVIRFMQSYTNCSDPTDQPRWGIAEAAI
jgi:hypothetical protein